MGVPSAAVVVLLLAVRPDAEAGGAPGGEPDAVVVTVELLQAEPEIEGGDALRVGRLERELADAVEETVARLAHGDVASRRAMGANRVAPALVPSAAGSRMTPLAGG